MKEGRGGEDKILGLRTALQAAKDGADSAQKEFDDANKVGSVEVLCFFYGVGLGGSSAHVLIVLVS